MSKPTWRAMRRQDRRRLKRAIARGQSQAVVGREPQQRSATSAVCENLKLYGLPEKRLILWDVAEHIVTRREALGYRIRFTMPRKPKRRIARRWTQRVAVYTDSRGFKRTRRVQDAPRKRSNALAHALAQIAPPVA